MSVSVSGPPPGALGAHLDLALLESRAQAILSEVGCANAELSVALVDDAAIAKLNGDFRGKPRATDVLSFSLLEGDHQRHRGSLLGDVVIGIETACRQARERHRAFDDELARLLIHGVLHLLGHDHEVDEEARAMRVEQQRLWRAIRTRAPAREARS